MKTLSLSRLSTFYILVVWLNGFSSLLVLIVYGYLGTFSRHMADDYCVIKFTRGQFPFALWENYLTVSNRFSNFMLIALSENVSPRSVAILPAIMISLWVIGVAWLLKEINDCLELGWTKPIMNSLAALSIFFALLEAPNRYQTLYWRSSMATHFAPLVFMPFFAIYLLRRFSSALIIPPSRWMYPLSFFLAFLLGGFSEPTALIMFLFLGISISVAWVTIKINGRDAILRLLMWSFTGVLTALLVMAFAPANSLRLGTPPPTLPVLIQRSFLYAYQFVINSIKTLPLPILLSFLIPFLVFLGFHTSSPVRLIHSHMKQLIMIILITPLFSYLLVVSSFAPSVYGQGFPVERARFAGQVCLVIGFMCIGAALGILLAQLRFLDKSMSQSILITSILLGITALYPLRAAWLALAELPEFKERAILWDARDAFIRRQAAAGEVDIIVPGYSGVHGIKELDDDSSHWVNGCAASYYNVHSIRAVSFRLEDILDYLSE